MLRAVGFDLDETLTATTRDRADILAAACEDVGAPEIARADYLRAHDDHSGRGSREPVFAALLAEYDGDVDPTALTGAYAEAVADAMEPVPGAAELVRTLRADYRVGLLTDGPVTTQREKLDRLGWTDLFDATVVTGDLNEAKPSAAAFAELCDALDAAPTDCVYVGDKSRSDVAGAAAAGLIPVQAVYDGGPAVHPLAAATVRRKRLPEELPAALRELSGR